jgi:DnaJ domain
MMAVPRRSERAADQPAEAYATGTPGNGEIADDEVANGDTVNGEHVAGEVANGHGNATLLPVLAEGAPVLATAPPEPPLATLDPGLYGVLGLDSSASDVQIQTTYRRMAAKLLRNGSSNQELKQLNVAYEVLGNPVRREEYDRLRRRQGLAPGAPTPIRPGAKVATRVTRRRRPRQAVQPHYAGLGDVMVVLMVVGLAVVAGFLLIPRLSVNLTALNALQAVLPLSSGTRPVLNVTVTAVPTAAPTATPEPSVSAQYSSSTVAVSNPNPAQNSSESVQIHLRRDGRPVPNSAVWASVQYRTIQERWPATGAVQTDSNGAATITFNIGPATPNYPVTVTVFAQVGDQQLSWAASFTPH